MKVFIILVSLIGLSTKCFATGPDCMPGDTQFVHIKEATDHGHFNGRYFCRIDYSSTNSYIGIIEGRRSFYHLATWENMGSCEPMERLHQLRSEKYPELGTPVSATIQFFDKMEVNSDCQPEKFIGPACSIALRFADSDLTFASLTFDSELNGDPRRCWNILDSIIDRNPRH